MYDFAALDVVEGYVCTSYSFSPLLNWDVVIQHAKIIQVAFLWEQLCPRFFPLNPFASLSLFTSLDLSLFSLSRALSRALSRVSLFGARVLSLFVSLSMRKPLFGLPVSHCFPLLL